LSVIFRTAARRTQPLSPQESASRASSREWKGYATGATLRGLVSEVCLQNPCGILLVAWNPVDGLCLLNGGRKADLNEAGLPPNPLHKRRI
jgi:hypothetical protein